MNFERNNLDKAASPYLRQHRDNPVFWQEWNQATLAFAESTGKPIFLSVGYSTCHWCHVMAREAFSDKTIAGYLNERFVAVKVDREERPDIDEFAMGFITATQGRGGWPLNVVLTPAGDPFFAGTYFPIEATDGLPGFLDVLEQVHAFYLQNAARITPFKPPVGQEAERPASDNEILAAFERSFDWQYFGFGSGTKFPPHTTLLYLLYYFEVSRDARVIPMITGTLDAMTRLGLNDHLQGGFFRYCTDRRWTIPHFEKMLYDQAMLLWVYSLGHKLFGRPRDKAVVEGFLSALSAAFDSGRAFYSGIDADTDHVEGATYLWGESELRAALTSEEFTRFSEVFDLSTGRYEGKIHLLKSSDAALGDIEKKLLSIRDARPQPEVDKKIITSWNALAGIGLVIAARHAGAAFALDRAASLAAVLLEEHYVGGRLVHSSTSGVKQAEGFLEDYAAMALFLSYLFEERGLFKAEFGELLDKTRRFYQDGRWMANEAGGDFHRVAAAVFDHPQPSPVALAEAAAYRGAVLLGREDLEARPVQGDPLSRDFHNLVSLLAKGNSYEIHVPDLIDWSRVPITAIQVKGDAYQICHNFQCRRYSSEAALLAALS